MMANGVERDVSFMRLFFLSISASNRTGAIAYPCINHHKHFITVQRTVSI